MFTRKTSKSLSRREFQGAAIDTGAQKTVIGLPQAKALCRFQGRRWQLKASKSAFRFGSQVHHSLGRVEVVIPTPAGTLSIDVDVVEPDVPLLLGLDVMDQHGLQLLSYYDLLECVPENWTLPVVRKHGHVYLCWQPVSGILFTRPQLLRLHRHFAHASTTKLMNLLRRAKVDELPDDTRATLDDIRSACHACQKHASKPLTFQVRGPDNIIFNQELRLDLVWLDTKPVLHVVDAGTTFSAAGFLAGEDVATVWNTFLRIWATIYVGYPQSILTDQGSVFMAEEWAFACELAEISLRHTGTESHNSLGAGERYHAPMRQIYHKLKQDHPSVPDDVRLALTVKSMNDVMGPEGLVPSLLVFGVVPRLPNMARMTFPRQAERFRALVSARKEYEGIVSRMRINTALRKKVPPAADHVFQPGEHVYVYRERLKHWTGPHLVESANAKDVRVHLGERTGPRSFNITSCKPALIAPVDFTGSTTLAREHTYVHWAEAIEPGDEREQLFDEAKRDELIGLIRRGTFRLVLEEELPTRPNVVPSRYVLVIKHKDTGEKQLKARFVLGGHRDLDKEYLVHSATNLQQASIRLMLALAACLGFNVWSTDINQAYLQAGSELLRDVFVRPEVLDLEPGTLLKLLKPLYGLSDSGEYWSQTLTAHHLEQLRMKQTSCDFALFMKRVGKERQAMSGCYVDDLLRIGTPEARDEMERKLRAAFDVKASESPPMTFTGMKISRSDDSGFHISLAEYVERLSPLDKTVDFARYRSFRAKLCWVVNCRPDIACAMSIAASVTSATFVPEHTHELNKVLHYLKKHKNIKLQYPKLDKNSLRLLVYADASFNNRDDHSSQLGYVIVLADETGQGCILQYSSRKSRRVTRSAMAGETIAFADAYDSAFMFKHELSRLLSIDIPLLMLTDSRSLFDVLTRSRYTTERRLMIDIAAARQAYNERLITNIALIKSEYNLADGLTKVKSNGALLQFLSVHRIQHPVVQYVIRPRLDAPTKRTN